jgi:TolB-like protein/Tfp pilus assembly protein PilF
VQRIRFGRFDVDLAAGQIHSRGLRIRLREQSFQVLSALLEQPGQVITREALRRRLWPDDTFVDFDNNLNTAVARLREALGDSADRPQYIETLPKHGYRFLSVVSHHPLLERTPAVAARLVVLPFVNLSGEVSREYISDAVTDEVTSDLACLAPRQLAVIARTTAMHYKGTQKDVARIGRELRVDFVLEGCVHFADVRIALNARLIRCDDQTQVLAKQYDVERAKLFDVERSLARDVLAQLGIAPDRGASAELCSRLGKSTENPEAYDEYIQGRHHLVKLTPSALATARAHLERAVALDPEFSLAYDGLADLHWHLGYFGFAPPREAFTTGILHALRAVEIDNTLAETHALLGQFHKQLDFNWPEVAREMARALQLNPESPIVRMRYAAHALMPHGRLAEAVAELERALELDPLSTGTRNWLAVMLLLWRQYDRAFHEATKLLELDPTSYWAHAVIAGTYRERRMFDEAIAAQRTATKLSADTAAMLGWLGLVLGLGGRTAEACDVLGRLEAMSSRTFVPPTSFAWTYLGLGETDRAFEWLDRAVEGRDQFMMPIKSYPFFDPIRSDPRFAALLRKMNLDADLSRRSPRGDARSVASGLGFRSRDGLTG